MPRHGLLHGYYGPSDRDMMRHDYSDLHPSFSGFGYRDHLPLSLAEKNLLLREEQSYLQSLAHGDPSVYDYPEYCRNSDEYHEAMMQRQHHLYLNSLQHQFSFGLPQYRGEEERLRHRRADTSPLDEIAPQLSVRRDTMMQSPRKKDHNTLSVQKGDKESTLHVKLEMKSGSNNSEEHSVKKEVKAGQGTLNSRLLGSTSEDKNSANKTIYYMQHQQSPPEQIAYMNGFRVPESPQMHNILKKIGQMRSPYIGMTVSGSKSHDSPRLMRFAKANLRSGNSNKNFDATGSPTNDANLLNYYNHMPSYGPPFPLHPYEEERYHPQSHHALRAALFEREREHAARFPYRHHLAREREPGAEPGLYSLQH